MLPKRRGLLRTAVGALCGTALMYLVMTLRSGRETPPISNALVQSTDDLSVSLAEVTGQLEHALSPANQRASCRSAIFPGGQCDCQDIPGDQTCAMKPVMDGKTPVCLGDGFVRPGRPCLLYSFGMRADLSFESEMVKFGCTVHVFDPLARLDTVTSKLPDGLHVHAIGVDSETRTLRVGGHELQMMTLDDLVRHMGHQGHQLDYLKIETHGEWGVLRQQFGGGATLRQLPQLAVTLHLQYPHGNLGTDARMALQFSRQDAVSYLQGVKDLEAAGFRLMASTPGEEKFGGTSLSHEYRTFWIQQR